MDLLNEVADSNWIELNESKQKNVSREWENETYSKVCVFVWVALSVGFRNFGSGKRKTYSEQKESNERNVTNNCEKKKDWLTKECDTRATARLLHIEYKTKDIHSRFVFFLLLYFSYFLFLGFCFLRKITIALGFSSLKKKQYHIIFFFSLIQCFSVHFYMFCFVGSFAFCFGRHQNRFYDICMCAFLDSILMAHQFRYYHFLNYYFFYVQNMTRKKKLKKLKGKRIKQLKKKRCVCYVLSHADHGLVVCWIRFWLLLVFNEWFFFSSIKSSDTEKPLPFFINHQWLQLHQSNTNGPYTSIKPRCVEYLLFRFNLISNGFEQQLNCIGNQMLRTKMLCFFAGTKSRTRKKAHQTWFYVQNVRFFLRFMDAKTRNIN